MAECPLTWQNLFSVFVSGSEDTDGKCDKEIIGLLDGGVYNYSPSGP
tara:strand:- start:1309 stop:1449 length:141 start_codon:yes stop_codon:yes gene_type:complete